MKLFDKKAKLLALFEAFFLKNVLRYSDKGLTRPTLIPVYGTTDYQSRELSTPVPKAWSDWRHAKNHFEILSYSATKYFPGIVLIQVLFEMLRV